MHMPSLQATSLHPTLRPRGRSVAVGGVVLTLLLAACGGASTTVAPSTVAVVPTPTVAPTSTVVPTSTVAPTPAPSLAMLPVLWEGDGPRAAPSLFGPAIDPVTGDIWVADSFDDQYWIFSPDGTYLESWGVAGTGDGQFDFNTHQPNPEAYGGIAFAPDGSFYVMDTGNDRVEKFDKDRGFVKAWGSFGTGDGQFAKASGIATDGQNVYVADDPRQDMQVFDTNGKFLRSFPFPFVLFTLAPDGHLYAGEWSGGNAGGVGGDAAVAEFDTDGTMIRQMPVPPEDLLDGGMAQVAVDAAGDIWAPIQYRSFPATPFELIEYDHAGSILDRWASGGETSVLSPDGKAIYFAYEDAQGGNWPFLRKNALPTP